MGDFIVAKAVQMQAGRGVCMTRLMKVAWNSVPNSSSFRQHTACRTPATSTTKRWRSFGYRWAKGGFLRHASKRRSLLLSRWASVLILAASCFMPNLGGKRLACPFCLDGRWDKRLLSWPHTYWFAETKKTKNKGQDVVRRRTVGTPVVLCNN